MGIEYGKRIDWNPIADVVYGIFDDPAFCEQILTSIRVVAEADHLPEELVAFHLKVVHNLFYGQVSMVQTPDVSLQEDLQTQV